LATKHEISRYKPTFNLRDEVQNILDDLDILFPGEGYAGHRLLIDEAVKKAEIRYQYYEQLALRSGQSAAIKRELAEKYHISVSTVNKYISRI